VIILRKGDIFDPNNQGWLVNPVNCVGVSGAGLAKEFKQRYPAQQAEYEKGCSLGYMSPGDIYGYKGIIYFATKDHWKDPSETSWIRAGLKKLRMWLHLKSPDVHMPALGCGCGGLDWLEVSQVICEELQDWEATVYLYVPS